MFLRGLMRSVLVPGNPGWVTRGTPQQCHPEITLSLLCGIDFFFFYPEAPCLLSALRALAPHSVTILPFRLIDAQDLLAVRHIWTLRIWVLIAVVARPIPRKGQLEIY